MRTTTNTAPQWMDIQQALRDLRTFTVGQLPLRQATPELVTALDGTPLLIPLVRVTPRADLVDLIRVHGLDGDGEAHYDWRFLLHPTHPSWAVLKVAFTAPARCVFTLQFNVNHHRALLRLAVAQRAMHISTSTNQCVDSSLGLTNLPVDELGPVLFTYEMLTAVHGTETRR